jgi:hypothetical protein
MAANRKIKTAPCHNVGRGTKRTTATHSGKAAVETTARMSNVRLECTAFFAIEADTVPRSGALTLWHAAGQSPHPEEDRERGRSSRGTGSLRLTRRSRERDDALRHRHPAESDRFCAAQEPPDTRCSERIRRSLFFSRVSVTQAYSSEQPFDPQLSSTNSRRFVPMEFRIAHKAIGETNRSDTFPLAPTSTTIEPPQAGAISNRPRDCNCLNLPERTDDLEVHVLRQRSIIGVFAVLTPAWRNLP